MTKRELENLTRLAGTTLWVTSDRRWISKLWRRYTKDRYLRLEKWESDHLSALRHKYLPAPYIVKRRASLKKNRRMLISISPQFIAS